MFNRFHSGYIEDTFDPRDVWEDELFAGEVDIPKEYRSEPLPYDYQGVYPFCVSFATTTLAEWKYKQLTGESHKFSPKHLFFNADGGEQGSSARQNLNVARDKGCIHYALDPMPEDVTKKSKDWLSSMRRDSRSIPFSNAKKILGYMRVLATQNSLKKAILQHGPLLVGVWVDKSYYSGNAKRTKDDDNHLVLLKDWTQDSWIIHDSLGWVRENDGEGTLSSDYTFRFAYAIEELPEDWKARRDEARKAPQGALEHYGLPRVWQKEKDAEGAILEAFRRFNNKEVFDAAGRFWTTYINAVAYGGYTVTDIVNDCYHWRRTGMNIFDFNLETREQWFKKLKKS